MSDDDRMKNLTWFADLRMILLKGEMKNMDEAIEEIYQLTNRRFKK